MLIINTYLAYCYIRLYVSLLTPSANSKTFSLNSMAYCKPISIRDDFFYELQNIKWFEASYFQEQALFTSMVLHVLQP